MPWSVVKKGEQYCVIKDSDGSSAGCHDTRDEALKQQAALYQSEAEAGALSVEDWEEAMAKLMGEKPVGKPD